MPGSFGRPSNSRLEPTADAHRVLGLQWRVGRGSSGNVGRTKETKTFGSFQIRAVVGLRNRHGISRSRNRFAGRGNLAPSSISISGVAVEQEKHLPAAIGRIIRITAVWGLRRAVLSNSGAQPDRRRRSATPALVARPGCSGGTCSSRGSWRTSPFQVVVVGHRRAASRVI